MKRNFSLIIILVLGFLLLLNPIAVAECLETKNPVITPESNRREGIEAPLIEINKAKDLLLQKNTKEKASEKSSSSTSSKDQCNCHDDEYCVDGCCVSQHPRPMPL